MASLLDRIARRLGYVPADLFEPTWQRVSTVETRIAQVEEGTPLVMSLWVCAPDSRPITWWYDGLQIEAVPPQPPRMELPE